jgi:hypothetical protein
MNKRTRLKRTLNLSNIGKEFYHPNVSKEEQMMTATLDHKDGTLDVFLFEDKMAELHIKEIKELKDLLEQAVTRLPYTNCGELRIEIKQALK